MALDQSALLEVLETLKAADVDARIRSAATTIYQALIEAELAGKAIQPQVLVSVTKPVSQTVTVTGEVTAGARVPLSGKGDRLLDVVASAGGVRAAVSETFVRLSRGTTTATVPMATVVSNLCENIDPSVSRSS